MSAVTPSWSVANGYARRGRVSRAGASRSSGLLVRDGRRRWVWPEAETGLALFGNLKLGIRRTIRNSRRMIVSYPRRQQLRRLRHAGTRASQAAIALAGALTLAATGEATFAFVALLLSVCLSLDGARAFRRARRSAVGAKSETQVRRALQPLTRDGWHVTHAVDWPAAGDLDHVVRSPLGIGFVIETKTLRYTRAHRQRTADAARWLGRQRRRYPLTVRPVICVARARQLGRIDGCVLVVSVDRLVPALTWAAGTAQNSITASTRPGAA